MEFKAESGAARRTRTDCVVIGVHDDGVAAGSGAAIDALLSARIARITAAGDFTGRLGETLMLPDLGKGPAARALLVGLGGAKTWSRRNYRKALTSAANAALKAPVSDVIVAFADAETPDTDAYYRARFVAEQFTHAAYRVPAIRSAKKAKAPQLKTVRVIGSAAELADTRRGLRDGSAIGAGASLTRDLANLPGNVCTPTYLAREAERMAREHTSVHCKVLGEREMRRLGMGSLLSVTAGSAQPPKLIVLEYRGRGAKADPIALVGKGVTFDTGGISLKDPGGMDEMKFDMTGAASVFGAIKTMALLNAPIRVVGIIPAVENMPSGTATKPGDIVTSMSGQTIEVLNTDAEGRLILCDALTYSRRFKPREVVDIATLTGACVIALGAHNSALMSNDDGVAESLLAAGQRSSDTCWRMPLAEEYQEQLKSNFADFANVAGRDGGAITAACFLGKFTVGIKWAHLDIAGTAYVTGAAKGATGRPVPLLVDYLLAKLG
jgi:leucyl aminopeptidase